MGMRPIWLTLPGPLGKVPAAEARQHGSLTTGRRLGDLRPASFSMAWSRDLVMWCAIVAAALIGVAVAFSTTTSIVAAGAVALVWLVIVGRRIQVVFLVALGVLVTGYAFLGRGLAHVGLGPVYVGELTLAIAVPATIVGLARVRLSVVHVFLLIFMAWGAIRTVPYIGAYGLDALRDSVTWSYGFFAIAVSVVLLPRHIPILVRAYRRIVPFLAIWLPLAALLTIELGDRIPAGPDSDVPIVYFKAGDAGVMLAGVAAFLLTGLFTWGRSRAALQEFAVWLAWLAGFALTAAENRGGMVAASMAVFSGLFVRRLTRWLIPLSIGVALLASSLLIDPQIDLGARNFSIDQLVQNVTSLLSNQSGTETEATKEWRLAWWGAIVGYTFQGPYFWTGKGYGINLADADGFQVTADDSLRAPHSTHLEILARSGVPGLVSWIALQAAFAAAMLLAALRAFRARSLALVAVIAWVFVYWGAALVDSSFDVYLGGPQGGIPFWADIGFGLVLCRMAADGVQLDLGHAPRERRAARPVTSRLAVDSA